MYIFGLSKSFPKIKVDHLSWMSCPSATKPDSNQSAFPPSSNVLQLEIYHILPLRLNLVIGSLLLLY